MTSEIPPANTPAEINIHLGYLRRDILSLTATTEKKLGEITNQISKLDDHYISEAEFRPVADETKQMIATLKGLTEWKDTFSGKMIGFGLGISAATSVITFILTYLFKK